MKTVGLDGHEEERGQEYQRFRCGGEEEAVPLEERPILYSEKDENG